MSNGLPIGVCVKRGSTYRRFKVRRGGKWVDLYVKLPPADAPEFPAALAKANAAAAAGAYGEEIEIR